MKTTKEERVLLARLNRTRSALLKALESSDVGKLRRASAAATASITGMQAFVRKRIARRRKAAGRG
jgi:hypothetical protein